MKFDEVNKFKELHAAYQHFTHFNDARDWGHTHYQELLEALADIRVDSPNSPLSSLYFYCGSASKLHNRLLWRLSDYDDKQFEDQINDITQLLHQYQVQEDIAVYHCTDTIFLKAMFGQCIPRKEVTAKNRGFISTSLDFESAKNFKLSHHKSAVLKLYIPKGTPGAFVEFKNSCLTENEFLLPPGAHLRFIGRTLLSPLLCPVWHCAVEYPG